MKQVPDSVIQQFFEQVKVLGVQRLGSGHIHQTFRLSLEQNETVKSYVLQKINTQIFPDPKAIMHNIRLLNKHLAQSAYPLQILQPTSCLSGDFLALDHEGNTWRAYPFLEQTLALDRAKKPQEVFQAAKAFACLLAHTSDVELTDFKTILPNFHNTPLRYQQMQSAIKKASTFNLKQAAAMIQQIEALTYLLEKATALNLPLRLTHNDTKINNVLLDQTGQKAVCVIDLDTLMPGYLLHDFGDMIRTMATTADEEEQDLSKVALWPEAYEAAARAFLLEMKPCFLPGEQESLLLGVQLIVYEQAIRFLTDYLMGNKYYPTHYPAQNLRRAGNQLQLLHSFLAKEKYMQGIIEQ